MNSPPRTPTRSSSGLQSKGATLSSYPSWISSPSTNPDRDAMSISSDFPSMNYNGMLDTDFQRYLEDADFEEEVAAMGMPTQAAASTTSRGEEGNHASHASASCGATDDEMPELQRQNGQIQRSMKNFALLSHRQLKKLGKSSYGHLADLVIDQLVQEQRDSSKSTTGSKDQQDSKSTNVSRDLRRRVFDCLNIMVSLGYAVKISPPGSRSLPEARAIEESFNSSNMYNRWIMWAGDSRGIHQQRSSNDFQKELQKYRESIQAQRFQLQENLLKCISFKRLLRRNRAISRSVSQREKLRLPFVLISVPSSTNVQVNVDSEAKRKVAFKFDGPFELHDETDVLQRMGLHLVNGPVPFPATQAAVDGDDKELDNAEENDVVHEQGIPLSRDVPEHIDNRYFPYFYTPSKDPLRWRSTGAAPAPAPAPAAAASASDESCFDEASFQTPKRNNRNSSSATVSREALSPAAQRMLQNLESSRSPCVREKESESAFTDPMDASPASRAGKEHGQRLKRTLEDDSADDKALASLIPSSQKKRRLRPPPQRPELAPEDNRDETKE